MKKRYKAENLERPSRLSRIFSSQKFFTFLVVLLLIFVVIPLYKNYQERKAINQEIDDIRVEIDKFQTDNSQLTDMLNYLESDASVEEKARLNLGFKKEGEEVVVIKDEDRVLNNMFDEEEEETVELSNTIKWFQYFFK